MHLDLDLRTRGLGLRIARGAGEIGSGLLALPELTDPGVLSPEGSPSIQRGVGRHPEDERGESGLVTKSMSMAMQAEEGLLRHVFGILTVAEHSHQQAEHPPLVTPDQLTIRVDFPKVVAFR